MPRLIQYNDLKNFIGLSKGESENPFIPLLLDTLTARFEDYLQRKLEKKERTETYIGSGRMVRLEGIPIDSAEDITVTQDGEEIDASEYEIRSFGILLKYQESSFEKPVTVTYTGGYATTTVGAETILNIPDAIKRAALFQITHENNKRKNPGAEVIQTDAGSVTAPPLELLKEVRATLDPYIHPMRLI